MISSVAFILLLIFTISSQSRRMKMLTKSFDGWVLDLVNLPIQGIVVPLIQTIFLYGLLAQFLPAYKGVLEFSPLVAFILNFVVVDYFYYWNHRLLHKDGLWNLHLVHHSVEDMDVLATSRNTLWTTFLIIYVWMNSAFIFLLKDPSFYVFGASLSAALDLWKHSNFPAPQFLADKFFLATPTDHQWHHSGKPHINYGANFNLWDKLHGTYKREVKKPASLGIKTNLPLWKAMFFPFKGSAS